MNRDYRRKKESAEMTPVELDNMTAASNEDIVGTGPIKYNRSKKYAAQRSEKRYQREIRLKKMLMLVTVLLFVFGLIAVDRGYSEMMDQRGKITPTVRRTDDETLVVSVFGKDIRVNTDEFDVRIVTDDEDHDEE